MKWIPLYMMHVRENPFFPSSQVVNDFRDLTLTYVVSTPLFASSHTVTGVFIIPRTPLPLKCEASSDRE